MNSRIDISKLTSNVEINQDIVLSWILERPKEFEEFVACCLQRSHTNNDLVKLYKSVIKNISTAPVRSLDYCHTGFKYDGPYYQDYAWCRPSYYYINHLIEIETGILFSKLDIDIVRIAKVFPYPAFPISQLDKATQAVHVQNLLGTEKTLLLLNKKIISPTKEAK